MILCCIVVMYRAQYVLQDVFPNFESVEGQHLKLSNASLKS